MNLRRDPLDNPEPLIRRVYAYVAYRIGPGLDAEDVTGEVFERAVRYRQSFDARKGDAGAWLIGIARRCIAERPSRPQTVELDIADDVAEAGPEDAAVRGIELRDALGRLAVRDRELIAMDYVGLTAPQIAALLEVSRNAVDVALHRARGRLRDELEFDAGDPGPTGRARNVRTRAVRKPGPRR